MFYILTPLICGPLSTIKAHFVQFNLDWEDVIARLELSISCSDTMKNFTNLQNWIMKRGPQCIYILHIPGTWPMRDCANTSPKHQVQRHSTLPPPCKAGNTNQLISTTYLLCTMIYSMVNSCLKINLQRNSAHVFIHHITHPKSSQVMWDYTNNDKTTNSELKLTS